MNAMGLVNLPNLVVAGVGKSGTTSLFWYLSQHPDICASQLKEINYFSALRHGADEPLPSLDTYSGYFSHCTGERYRMEASPAYFYGGEQVIRGLRETLGTPRVLISLRDPVTRLWSAYTFLKSMGRLDEGMDFEHYVDECERHLPPCGGVQSLPEKNTPLSVGFYMLHLQPWFDAFGKDLRIVFAEDLFTKPRRVVEDLCAWLQIDCTAANEIDYRIHNRTIQPKSHRLAKLAYRGQNLSDRFFRRYPAVRGTLRKTYAAVNARSVKERLDPRMRLRLESLYRESNAATARDLARRGYRDLPEWLSAP